MGILKLNQHEARTHDMPGDPKTRPDAFANIIWLAVIRHQPQHFKRRSSIIFVIQRQRGSMFCKIMAVTIVGFLFLKPRRIGQQNL